MSSYRGIIVRVRIRRVKLIQSELTTQYTVIKPPGLSRLGEIIIVHAPRGGLLELGRGVVRQWLVEKLPRHLWTEGERVHPLRCEVRECIRISEASHQYPRVAPYPVHYALHLRAFVESILAIIVHPVVFCFL